MTSVDLCAMYKPWLVQEDVVSTIMDEFWQEVCLILLLSFFFLPDEQNENAREMNISFSWTFVIPFILRRAMKKSVEAFNHNP